MKKISSNSNKLIIGFIVKAAVSTLLSVLLFSFIATQIIYRFDLSLDTSRICSVIICTASAFVISLVTTHGLKNNSAIIGMLSQIGLIFFSLINLIFNENSLLFFIIKLALILLVGAATGFINENRSKKIKV